MPPASFGLDSPHTSTFAVRADNACGDGATAADSWSRHLRIVDQAEVLFNGVQVPGVAREVPGLLGIDLGEERVAAADDVDPLSNPHRLGEVADVLGSEVARGPRAQDLLGMNRLASPMKSDAKRLN